jgi:putative FmdB family regulatory protein
MPIYEYTCRKCKAHVEALQKVTDKPLVKCKKCGGRLEKEWSQTGFQFKGSGWYVTDYARKGAAGKDDGSGDSKSESKSETKSETKSEAKSDGGAGSDGAKKTPKAKSSSKGAGTD